MSNARTRKNKRIAKALEVVGPYYRVSKTAGSSGKCKPKPGKVAKPSKAVDGQKPDDDTLAEILRLMDEERSKIRGHRALIVR